MQILFFLTGCIVGALFTNLLENKKDDCKHEWKPIKEYKVETFFYTEYGIISKCKKCNKLKKDKKFIY